MGSPPSPVLANLTCGVGYEQSYIAEMGTADGERIWGIRSMDDVVTVGTYTKDRAGSYERAVQKLESLAYHESMELERTDDGTDGWQRYLEGEIRIDQNRINVRFFNANSVSLLDNGTCIKPKIQVRSLIYTSINSAELCIWSFKQNERLWAGPSPDAVAGRKALAYGVKSSRMEESVGNNKGSQA